MRKLFALAFVLSVCSVAAVGCSSNRGGGGCSSGCGGYSVSPPVYPGVQPEVQVQPMVGMQEQEQVASRVNA